MFPFFSSFSKRDIVLLHILIVPTGHLRLQSAARKPWYSTLLWLCWLFFFSPLVVAIPPRTDGRMGSPPSQSIDPTCPHVWRIEGLGREGIVQEEVVCFGVCCVCVPATSQPPARPAVWMNNAGAVLSLRVCAQALSPSNPTTATSSCRSINT